MLTKFRILNVALVTMLSCLSFAHSESNLSSSTFSIEPEKQIELFADRQVDRLNRIAQFEKHLDSERERIFSLELAPDFFIDSIYRELSEFSETELKFLLEGDLSKIQNSTSRKRAESVLRTVSQFSATHEDFQNQLDKMAILELDYFIEGTMVAMDSLHKTLAENNLVTTKELANSDRVFALATSEYQRYMRHRLEVGDPRDGPNRTDAYRSFYTAAKDYFDFAYKVTKPSNLQAFWDRLRNNTRTIYNLLNTFIRIAPGMIKVGITAMTRTNGLADRSPLIDSIDDIFRKIGKITGHTVKIEGSEYLPPKGKPDGKTVYIIAPTHRDPIRDGIIMSNLGISNYLLAMATDQMMPKRLADKFTSNDNIITVGRGSGTPIEKILKELKRGLTNIVMIYPEGSVSAGLYETRPVREKFSWGLIEALLNEGYDVKLLPLTYQNSGQFVHRNTVAGFFKNLDSSTNRELQVTVSPPVNSKTLRLLAKATKSTAIGNFIRATWLQGLPHNEDFNNGMMRVKAAAKQFEIELGISLLPKVLQCKSFYQE